ncbi:hypothetical protein PRIPAC_88748 [Pristionchus pacificus]|uniref:Uncharacterized protein n=1 Tax=Pristionchus pacificus TaxID=54126 RepID=A0A2A6CX89_PRIPA|nr:hypothetical protein PRIPAC_88748 [Pristionchus pacificus]|eukprot:PDM82795.1 hypothetical protein PRIPAC_37188 [Pristionchus pacificus]
MPDDTCMRVCVGVRPGGAAGRRGGMETPSFMAVANEGNLKMGQFIHTCPVVVWGAAVVVVVEDELVGGAS